MLVGVDIGITQPVVVIVRGPYRAEGGVDGQAEEQGQQGVDDGTVGPVRGRVPGGALSARLYGPIGGVRASTGRAVQLVARGGWAGSRRRERDAGRGVPGLAARRGALPLSSVASWAEVPARCAARARRGRRRGAGGGLTDRCAAGAL